MKCVEHIWGKSEMYGTFLGNKKILIVFEYWTK